MYSAHVATDLGPLRHARSKHEKRRESGAMDKRVHTGCVSTTVFGLFRHLFATPFLLEVEGYSRDLGKPILLEEFGMPRDNWLNDGAAGKYLVSKRFCR